MRLLFTSVPACGRLFPLVPLARAAVGRGHEVLVGTASTMHEAVARADLHPAPVGVSIEDLRKGGNNLERNASTREDRVASFLFTNVWPESALPALLAIGRKWKPDAIIHEEGEFAAPLAAALLQLPSIAVSWAGPTRSAGQWEMLERAIAPLWRNNGLVPERRAGLFRTLYLDTCPATLQDQTFKEQKASPLRPIPYDGAECWHGEDWLARLERDAIFVTLGTVSAFNNAPNVIRQVIEALRDTPRQVAISIGEALDANLLGEIPRNVHLTRFVPQSLVVQRTALVICHAGPGTAACALGSALPLLLMPRGGAVQQRVAKACSNAGVALVLAAKDVSAERIRDCARDLIEDGSYRDAAARIAAQISAMPGAEDVLPQIENAIAAHVESASRPRKSNSEASSWMRLQ